MNAKIHWVLVVEDDRSLRSILGMTLREAGFESTEVGSGAEALAAMTDRLPDAVVLDLGLPDRRTSDVLNHLSQLRELQDFRTSLVVTSTLNYEDANRRYDLEGVQFLAKPFNPWELVKLLNTGQ